MAVSDRTRLAVDVALFLASQAALYYALQRFLNPPGPEDANASRSLKLLQSRGHAKLKLTDLEKVIASEVIHPDDIDIHFSDIGGLEPIISSLRESIIYPLIYPHLFPTTSLLSAPKGVLLFGPPGTGKTMLAKALAKESGATFINVKGSTLASKWYGDSNRLVSALFSLAKKTQPSIIFMDEIDSFLRERDRGDHEVTGMVKAEFMSTWDGLTSSSDRILVLGATNRPGDIDAAFLRRMPKRFAIGMPDAAQREKILKLMLKDTLLAPDFPLGALAERADGLSGSDLKELCRGAAMRAVRERMSSFAEGKTPNEVVALRPLTLDDFVKAGEQHLAMVAGVGGTREVQVLKEEDVDDLVSSTEETETVVSVTDVEEPEEEKDVVLD